MATEMPLEFPGDQELVRRLEAFAEVRLAPTSEATARMRAAVLGSLESRRARSEPITITTQDRRWRRPVAALLAACLTISVAAGSALAANPGGPLYAARLWTERLTLPSGAGRTDAEIARLDARLQEAAHASATGDHAAEIDALEAYAAIAAETANEAAADPAALDALAVHVRDQDPTLTSLATSMPPSMRSRALTAVANATGVIDRGHDPTLTLGGDPGTSGDQGRERSPERPVRDRPDGPARRPTTDRAAGGTSAAHGGTGGTDGHGANGQGDPTKAASGPDGKDAKGGNPGHAAGGNGAGRDDGHAGADDHARGNGRGDRGGNDDQKDDPTPRHSDKGS